jgi:hypothetical protein
MKVSCASISSLDINEVSTDQDATVLIKGDIGFYKALLAGFRD